MHLRTKKFLVTAAMSILFTTTVYAGTAFKNVQVYRSNYLTTTVTTKTSFKAKPLIQLTQGPVEDKCAMRVQLVRSDNKAYCTDEAEFTACGYKEANYLTIAYYSSEYRGHDFNVNVKITDDSVYSANTACGEVWP